MSNDCNGSIVPIEQQVLNQFIPKTEYSLSANTSYHSVSQKLGIFLCSDNSNLLVLVSFFNEKEILTLAIKADAKSFI